MADSRHRSRHRPARRSVAPARIATAAVVVILLAGGGYFASTRLASDSTSSGDCAQTMPLTVRTGPTLTAPLTQIATTYNGERHRVLGKCVQVKVETVDSGQTAQAIAAGWADQQYGQAPDVWVPESAAWVSLAKTTAAGVKLLGSGGTSAGTVVASSPVVLAMPRPMALALGWPDRQLSWADLRANENSTSFWSGRGHPEWGDFDTGFANPRTSSAGIAAVLNVVASSIGQPSSALTAAQFTGDLTTKGAVLSFERGADLVADSDPDLLASYLGWGKNAPEHMSALVMPESLVYQANVGASAAVASDDSIAAGAVAPAAVPLVAAYPTDGLVVDDASYQALGLRAGSDRAAAAADFQGMLLGGEGQATFSSDGFRSPDRRNPKLTEKLGLIPTLRTEPRSAPDGRTIDGARHTFQGVHQRGNTLAVLDTSGSMDLPVSGSDGKTRLQIALGAAAAAIPLFASDSRLGLWQFSTRLDGMRPYRELVPVGPMSDGVDGVPRTQALAAAVAGLRAQGGTGLYATALAAFEALSAQYQPDKPNQVVLLTDGQNDDPTSSLSLDQLVAQLKAEYNPKKPVHIITIGYGADADLDALGQIAAATGSKTYPAKDPNTIFTIMVNALTDN